VFGPWGLPATVQAYSRWAAEWHGAQGKPVERVDAPSSVARLILAYLEYAAIHFRKHGRPTSEVYAIRAAVGTVNSLYGATPAAEFTPTRLLAIQAAWVREGKSIKTCNEYMRRIVKCWSWGVSRMYVSAAVADALKHVPGLVPGRTTAPARVPVRAASEDSLVAVLDRLHEEPRRRAVLAAIVSLLRTTGMRPGEVLELRAEDVDRSREPWEYRPASGGKTYHLDKARCVWIGPRGRELLAPWLDKAEAGQPVFRLPRRRGAGLAVVRIEFLRQRLAAACAALGLEVITPHQIRHTFATSVQRQYEDDAAVAAAIGNSPEVARRVYVDDPGEAVGRRIAEEMG
jgi:integrase